MINPGNVHQKIKALAPIDGIQLGPGDTLAGAVISFNPSATQQEIDAANAALAAMVDADVDFPETVTRYQFKKAVLDAGQLDTIKGVYANLSDAAKLYWDEADMIGRNSVLITELQAELSFTDTQVNNFFRNAQSIKP